MSEKRTQGSGSRFLYEPLGQRTDAEPEQASPNGRRNNLAATLGSLWHLYTQSVGIIAIAAAISFGIMRAMSTAGPVIEVVSGPFPVSTKIPYRGILSYRVSTRRLESCEGTVVYTFTRAVPRVSVVIARPIPAGDIRSTLNSLIRIELPDSVYPGVWKFQSTVDSQCPTYSRQDPIAGFQIEVLAPEGQ
jgi:hypothetical protein